MLVKDYMIKHPPMVEPDASIVEAQHKMIDNNIRHLPVVGDGKRLVGLLTRQTMLIDPTRLASLDVWEITRQLSSTKAKDVMVMAKVVMTVDPDTPIEQAALMMVENQIGCLPVIEEGVVVGLITEGDLLAHLTEMMAVRSPGVRVTVRMPKVSGRGELAKLVEAVAAQGWAITSLGGAQAPRNPDKWDAVIKLQQPKEAVLEALSGIENHEIIDVRET